MRVGKGAGRCLLLLILTGAPWAAAAEATEPPGFPATPEEIETRIETLKPDFAAPRGHIADAPEEAGPPFRLDGVSLIQGDKPVQGDPVCIDGNQPLAVVGYWEPVTRLSAALPIRIHFW